MNNLFAWLLTSVCWTLGIFCFYRANQKQIIVDQQNVRIKIFVGAFLIILGIVIQKPDYIWVIPGTLVAMGAVNLITIARAEMELHNLNLEAQQDSGKGGDYQRITKRLLRQKINHLARMTGFYSFLAILFTGILVLQKILK